MKSINTFTLLTFVVITTLNCSSNDSIKANVKIINKQNDVSKMLTITKIKKPWYAPKGFVIKKMKKTIPTYRNVQGLKEKNYAFAEGTKYFGGIYHWSSENDAKAWFNNKWFESIKSKYGVAGSVEYFRILEKMVYLEITEESQFLWTVLNFDMKKVSKQDDLVQVIKTKDEQNKNVTFSFWINKSSANHYLEKQTNAKIMLLPATIYN